MPSGADDRATIGQSRAAESHNLLRHFSKIDFRVACRMAHLNGKHIFYPLLCLRVSISPRSIRFIFVLAYTLQVQQCVQQSSTHFVVNPWNLVQSHLERPPGLCAFHSGTLHARRFSFVHRSIYRLAADTLTGAWSRLEASAAVHEQRANRRVRRIDNNILAKRIDLWELESRHQDP